MTKIAPTLQQNFSTIIFVEKINCIAGLKMVIVSMQSTRWGQVTHICVSTLRIIGSDNGPLARYVKLRVRMRRKCREGFPDTAGKRSRHASRRVRDARAVMHAGIAN